MAWGGSKSGNPWDRFTAPYFRETRVIRRITESVKSAVRADRGWGMGSLLQSRTAQGAGGENTDISIAHPAPSVICEITETVKKKVAAHPPDML